MRADASQLEEVHGAAVVESARSTSVPQTLAALEAPATPARRGYYDECFRGPTKFSLGFMKPSELVDFGSEAAFGAPGAGGSMGFADPSQRLGYGYVTDKMGMSLQGDPRDLALRDALATVLAGG